MENYFTKRGPDVVTESIDGEVVVIDLDNGSYYSLEECGSYVWESLTSGLAAIEIEETLLSAFPENQTAVTSGVKELLQRLIEAKLIVPIEKSEVKTSERPAIPKSCSNFQLQSYTDMQELLMLDPIHEVEEAGWPKKKDAT